ncbi:MAG: alpha/beta fold hydrolase [Actinomycetota bacterium]
MPLADLGDVTLHYQRRGSGSAGPQGGGAGSAGPQGGGAGSAGPQAVLGIMGFGLDQRFWASQIPVVTETHEFITFDNRGIGRSAPAGDGAPLISTIADMADDTSRLLDHLAIESCVVYGISMGGAVAQHLALEHPERVSALILAATWARPIEFMRRQHTLARALIEAGGPALLVESSLVRMFTPAFFEVGAEVLDQMVRAFMAETGPDLPSTEVLLAQMDAVDKHDVLGRLEEINVPTLVIGARNDMMVPYFGAEEIAAAIPGAELVTLDTGHGCMIEEMPAYNAALQAFLAAHKA